MYCVYSPYWCWRLKRCSTIFVVVKSSCSSLTFHPFLLFCLSRAPASKAWVFVEDPFAVAAPAGWTHHERSRADCFHTRAGTLATPIGAGTRLISSSTTCFASVHDADAKFLLDPFGGLQEGQFHLILLRNGVPEVKPGRGVTATKFWFLLPQAQSEAVISVKY